MDTPRDAAPRRRPLAQLPGDIWALGLVSLLMDISSELVHSLLPALMTTVLGAGMVTIGAIEGVAGATAAVAKVFSGALSDFFRKRKALAVIGYGLSAFTKPLFPLATSVGWVFAARFADRIGKGIRGAPRDALVADITPPELRGAAYGLRQALDSLGAVIGPVLALALMAWLAGNIRAVLWVAVVPGLLAVLVLVAAVHEPRVEAHPPGAARALTWAAARQLSWRYWWVVAIGVVFNLARFSEAFLVLRGQDVGLALGYLPAVMIVMNLADTVLAYPAGMLADRAGARGLLAGGLLFLILADGALAMAHGPAGVLAGATLWGAHLGCTQGLLSKLVADAAPRDLRGTAFGIFNLCGGGALLLASLAAGGLWSAAGPAATFVAGAALAGLALLGLVAYPQPRAAPTAPPATR